MQRQAIPYSADISVLFAAFADLPHAFLLDSGKPRQTQGRYDVFSAWPERELSIGKDGFFYHDEQHNRQPLADIHAVKNLLSSTQTAKSSDLPFSGGWLGFARYELAELLEPRSCSKLCELSEVFWAGYYTWAVVQDHVKQCAWLIWQDNLDNTKLTDIRRLLTQSITHAPFGLTRPFSANTDYPTYQQQVERIQQYIKAGDCYQVNYSIGFSAPFNGCSFSAYQQLRQAVPSPYMAFIQHGRQQLLSISPERFIAANGRNIHSKPIKGTAPRGHTSAEDYANAQALLNSVKNRAENVMIVDLIRNDFGRHCTPGSIRVDALCALESFENVHHLVSTISGTLNENSNVWDVFFSSFPGGSITGAPKIRACQIIDELEQGHRDIYCGCIFMASDDGQFDSNICIRTLMCEEGIISARAGGGIVADSTAASEYQECLNKIGALLKAL